MDRGDGGRQGRPQDDARRAARVQLAVHQSALFAALSISISLAHVCTSLATEIQKRAVCLLFQKLFLEWFAFLRLSSQIRPFSHQRVHENILDIHEMLRTTTFQAVLFAHSKFVSRNKRALSGDYDFEKKH